MTVSFLHSDCGPAPKLHDRPQGVQVSPHDTPSCRFHTPRPRLSPPVYLVSRNHGEVPGKGLDTWLELRERPLPSRTYKSNGSGGCSQRVPSFRLTEAAIPTLS